MQLFGDVETLKKGLGAEIDSSLSDQMQHVLGKALEGVVWKKTRV